MSNRLGVIIGFKYKTSVCCCLLLLLQSFLTLSLSSMCSICKIFVDAAININVTSVGTYIT